MEEGFFYYLSPNRDVLLTIPKVDATIAMTTTASENHISAARATKLYVFYSRTATAIHRMCDRNS